jgi:hypothetical protein
MQGGDLKSAFNRVVHGNLGYTNSAQNVLDQFGGEQIVGLSVNRTHISISAGLKYADKLMPKFAAKRAKLGYDQFFHLYVLITLESGEEVAIEKNEVITISTGPAARKGAESLDIKTPNATTLSELMERTEAKMGAKFFPYNVQTNNCQAFVLALLQSNKVSSPAAKRFTKQNLKFLPSGAVSILNGVVQLIGNVSTLLS